MAARHVVVDGSNIATEGRSTPSLAQLDQAVREFIAENPEAVLTVIVDASFAHRIDPSEVPLFEEAEAAGELVSPPAGAIGRGDAFLLRIADKTGATVLSNDSFQEFHGDHEWLFDKGRLVGGKPVPGIGWIFTPRTPVRGPRSREAVKEARRKKKGDTDTAVGVPGLDLAAERARTMGKGKRTVERAIAVATEEAVAPKGSKRRRRRKGGQPPADAVNDPLTFITFIAAHPLGSEVTATVESFASHGAFVDVEGARCYVPLSAMGSPAPKSAREVVAKGEQLDFVIQALDPQRRGIELALPAFARIAGAPTEETVEAEIAGEADGAVAGKGAVEPLVPATAAGPGDRVATGSERPLKTGPAPGGPGRRPPADGAAAATGVTVPGVAAHAGEPGATKTPARSAANKAAAKKAAAKKAPAKKAPAKKVVVKEAPAKKAPAKKAPAEKAPAKKAVMAPPAEAAPPKKAPAKKAAPAQARTAKAATAPPEPVGDTAVVARKAASSKAPASRKAAAASTETAPEKGAPTKRAARGKASGEGPTAAPEKVPARKKAVPDARPASARKAPAAKASAGARTAAARRGPGGASRGQVPAGDRSPEADHPAP